MSDAVKTIQANLERAITVDAKDLKTADKDRTETFKLTFKSSIDSLLSLYDQMMAAGAAMSEGTTSVEKTILNAVDGTTLESANKAPIKVAKAALEVSNRVSVEVPETTVKAYTEVVSANVVDEAKNYMSSKQNFAPMLKTLVDLQKQAKHAVENNSGEKDAIIAELHAVVDALVQHGRKMTLLSLALVDEGNRRLRDLQASLSLSFSPAAKA